MTAIELSFGMTCSATIPADHGYALLGAVSRLIPDAHSGVGFAIAPIRGCEVGGRQISIDARSPFVIRTSPDRICEFLPLAGKSLDLLGRKIVLGVPSIHQLTACATVRARMVTIKGFFERILFRDAVRRQLDLISVGDCMIDIRKKRTLRIKQQEIVGYETVLDGLSEHESLIVGTNGVGGRRHMGCGFFVPFEQKENHG
ncbi:MAG: type I-MYXAN CRISPR-associated protein Cas6/Cmx6 [Pirellula sp.]